MLLKSMYIFKFYEHRQMPAIVPLESILRQRWNQGADGFRNLLRVPKERILYVCTRKEDIPFTFRSGSKYGSVGRLKYVENPHWHARILGTLDRARFRPVPTNGSTSQDSKFENNEGTCQPMAHRTWQIRLASEKMAANRFSRGKLVPT